MYLIGFLLTTSITFPTSVLSLSFITCLQIRHFFLLFRERLFQNSFVKKSQFYAKLFRQLTCLSWTRMFKSCQTQALTILKVTGYLICYYSPMQYHSKRHFNFILSNLFYPFLDLYLFDMVIQPLHTLILPIIVLEKFFQSSCKPWSVALFYLFTSNITFNQQTFIIFYPYQLLCSCQSAVFLLR